MGRISYNFAAILPEFILLVTLLCEAFAYKFRRKATPKTFYTIAKCGLALAFVSAFVLYNQNFSSSYGNNAYTTLFKLMIYCWAAGCFHLSLKWFLGLDRPSFRFYSLGLAGVLFLTAALSLNNLAAFVFVFDAAFALNYFLIKTESDEENTAACARNFLISAVGFILLDCWGVWELCGQAGSCDFEAVRGYLAKAELSLSLFLACAALIIGLLFKLGAAPFHFWTAEAVGEPILPVSCFISLVPVVAYYAGLIKLIVKALFPAYPAFEVMMQFFAVVSILIGLIGANGEGNLRRMFAYAALFNTGIMLAVLSAFDEGSIQGSFVYLLSYLLAMSGVYMVFYGLKSKGDYLVTLKSISGAAEGKPLLAAALLVFLISMLGLPPMLGFLGLVSVLNDLVALHQYWMIIVILGGKLLMAYAYLKVIKVVYFDKRENIFDRVDQGIYICLFLNIVFMAAVILKPRFYLSILQGFLS